jgi:hypothetical protein
MAKELNYLAVSSAKIVQFSVSIGAKLGLILSTITALAILASRGVNLSRQSTTIVHRS